MRRASRRLCATSGTSCSNGRPPRATVLLACWTTTAIRVLLFVVGAWQRWDVLVFRSECALSRPRVQSRFRFPVAVPLGINGDERHAKAGRVYKYYPILIRLCPDAREVRQLSMRKRRVAGLPRGRRPARAILKGRRSTTPFTTPACRFRPVAHSTERLRRWAQGRRFGEPQEQSLFTTPVLRGSSSARPHAPLLHRCARERRFRKESRYSLSLLAVRRQRRAQRAPTSCSPPPARAADCAAQRAARATTHSLPNSVGFGLRRPARASKMPRRKPGGSTNRKSTPTARPGAVRKPVAVFEPEEQHGPKQSPVLRPVSASLRLR